MSLVPVLRAYPVKAYVPLVKKFTAVLAHVSLPEPSGKKGWHALISFQRAPYTATLKQQGHLYSVSWSHQLTDPGDFPVKVILQDGGNEKHAIETTIIVGSGPQRLVAWMLDRFLGNEANPDTTGYITQLAVQGASLQQLAMELVKSPAFLRKIFSDSFHDFLGRLPTPAERKSLLPDASDEDPVSGSIKAVLGSQLFYEHAGASPESFIQLAWQGLAGKKAIPSPHFSYLLEQLNEQPAGRDNIVQEMMQSLPVLRHTASVLFTPLIGKPPTGNLLNDIVNRFQSNSSWSNTLGSSLNNFPHGVAWTPPDETLEPPDFTFQFFAPLDDANAFAGGTDVRAFMISSIKDTLAALGPQYDAQLQSMIFLTIADLISEPEVDSIAFQGQENGAIWFNGGQNDFSLMVLETLGPTTTYRFAIRATALKNIMDTVWANYPKQLNKSGKPDPNGQIKLTRYSMEFDPVKKSLSISLYATFYATSTMSFDIHLTFTDTFSLDNSGEVQVNSTSTLYYDSGVDIVAGFQALLSFFIPYPFNDIAFSVLGLQEPPLPSFSLGQIIASFFPSQIFIPGTIDKLVFPYSKLVVDPDEGISVDGSEFPVSARFPQVAVVGQLYIFYPDYLKPYTHAAVGPPGIVSLTFLYVAQTQDMRAPLTVNWSTDGAMSDIQGITVNITWQFEIGTRGTRTVSVQVTDADGLTATDSKTITFNGMQRDPPTNTGNPNRKMGIQTG